jgi:hypothetical protein
MSIGRVLDGVTAERRHAGTPPCGDSSPPPMLAGDTRPGDREKSLEYSDEGEGA